MGKKNPSLMDVNLPKHFGLLCEPSAQGRRLLYKHKLGSWIGIDTGNGNERPLVVTCADDEMDKAMDYVIAKLRDNEVRWELAAYWSYDDALFEWAIRYLERVELEIETGN